MSTSLSLASLGLLAPATLGTGTRVVGNVVVSMGDNSINIIAQIEQVGVTLSDDRLDLVAHDQTEMGVGNEPDNIEI